MSKNMSSQNHRAKSGGWDSYFKWVYVAAFIALSATYLGLTLIPAPDKAVLTQHHITASDYRWLVYPAVILLAVSWIFGLVGSFRMKAYSNIIRKSSDGSAFNYISAGFLLYTFVQPLSSLTANVFGHIEKHVTGAVPTLTIINNYIAIVGMGVAFVLISVGAERLSRLAKAGNESLMEHLWVGAFIIFSSIYSYFIVIQPLHTPLARRVYFLPPWLLISTIAIPYLYIWYRGLNAAFRIFWYRRNIQGRLYRSALSYLAGGTTVVIASSIATRTITTISAGLNRLSLTPLLFIVYGLILLIAIGFVLIAIGANKLRRIEEV